MALPTMITRRRLHQEVLTRSTRRSSRSSIGPFPNSGDQRYEAVVHLVTAAIGAERFYTLENNKARMESRPAEEAIALDGGLAGPGSATTRCTSWRTAPVRLKKKYEKQLMWFVARSVSRDPDRSRAGGSCATWMKLLCAVGTGRVEIRNMFF